MSERTSEEIVPNTQPDYWITEQFAVESALKYKSAMDTSGLVVGESNLYTNHYNSAPAPAPSPSKS